MIRARGVTLAAMAAVALMAGATAPGAWADDVNAYGGTKSAGSPSSAGSPRIAAASAVGQVAPNAGSAFNCGDLTGVQTASGTGAPTFTVPTDGVVTAFSHNANSGTGSVRGVLFRATGVPADKLIVGKSALVPIVPSTLMTFPARIPVRAGDLLGIQVKNSVGTGCAFPGVAGDAHDVSFAADPDVSSSFTSEGTVPGNRWNISAVLEPDADGDGYGDVSQDLCPQSNLTQAACPAPDTTVTKKPKKSSSHRTVKIKFTSSVPGSTFTCAVDGKAAKPCTSPFKKRFRYGKHKVLITATSPFGIVETTPAKVKFRIMRPA
jgi:hypothetical protein